MFIQSHIYTEFSSMHIFGLKLVRLNLQCILDEYSLLLYDFSSNLCENELLKQMVTLVF